MDVGVLEGLVNGLAQATDPINLGVIVIGVTLGILLGAAPGMGPTMGMAISLPFIIRFPPERAIFLLMSIAIGSGFGNSIPAVLLGIPGTPAALLTVLEGKPLAERGEGRRALITCLLSSFTGQFMGTVVFILFVIPLATIAIGFLFPEIFALTVFALLAVIGVAGRNVVRAALSVVIGLVLGLVGPDSITGLPRLDFGMTELQIGLGVVPVLIGLLAVREIILEAEKDPARASVEEARSSGFKPPSFKWLQDWKDTFGSTSLGTAISSFIGALPGEGPTVATFIIYGAMHTRPAWKKDLGKGSLRALAAIDSADNAASTTALIPTLALGIPGSAPMVIILALLGTQGFFPGPDLLETQPQMIHNVFGGLMLACFVLLVIGYLSIGPSVYLSNLSHGAVLATSLVLVVVGVYSLRWSMADVWIAVATGILGYVMSKLDYPIAPAALAFILAPILEKNLRRGLVMTDGIVDFLSRPVTLTILGLGVLLVIGELALRNRIEEQMLDDATKLEELEQADD